jgi:hypothetical protein
VLASIGTVWAKYQSWGKVRATITQSVANVSLTEIPHACSLLAPWLEGVVAQTLTLSGASDVVATVTVHDATTVAVQVRWAQPTR